MLKTLFAVAGCLFFCLPIQSAPAKKDVKKEIKKDPKKDAQPQLRSQYSAAQDLFNAGKFAEALMRYDQILRRYPGYEPAMIQMAKTLYRLERFPESYQVFARINPKYLDPETSYEYGYSFYNAKQWEGSLAAFTRVPSGHALYDLANYYGALAAVKLKKYDEAEEMLEKAVVLPEKLAKSRALYLKHIQTMQLLQQQNDLTKQRDDEKKKGTSPTKVTTNDKQTVLVTSKTIYNGYTPKSVFFKPSALQYQGMMDLEKLEHFAKLSYIQEERETDYNGNSTETARTQIGEFKFADGPIFYLPWKGFKGHQPTLGLHIYASAEDRNTRGKEQRIVIFEDSADIPRIQERSLEVAHTKGGKIGAAAWIESPLPNYFWVGAGSETWFYFPEFERAGRYGSFRAYSYIGYHNFPQFVRLRASFEQLIDKTNEPSTDIGSADLLYHYEFPFNLELDPALNYKSFHYLTKNVDGPDTSIAISGRVIQRAPFGFSVYLFGAYENQSNYVKHGLPGDLTAAADGNIMTGQGGLKFEKFSWIFGELSQTFSQTNWQSRSEDTKSVFDKNVPNYMQMYRVSVGLNVLF